MRFTSAAANDSFMLAPSHYSHNQIVALDRAYIDYAKFEELTERDVVYVTKMKKFLNNPSHDLEILLAEAGEPPPESAEI